MGDRIRLQSFRTAKDTFLEIRDGITPENYVAVMAEREAIRPAKRTPTGNSTAKENEKERIRTIEKNIDKQDHKW